MLRSEYGWRFAGKEDANGNAVTVDTALQTRVYVNHARLLKVLEKKASSEDAEEVDSLMAKAENKVMKPDESHAWIVNLAYAAKFVSSRAELEALSQLGM